MRCMSPVRNVNGNFDAWVHCGPIHDLVPERVFRTRSLLSGYDLKV
jgi:hypothetical protein